MNTVAHRGIRSQTVPTEAQSPTKRSAYTITPVTPSSSHRPRSPTQPPCRVAGSRQKDKHDHWNRSCNQTFLPQSSPDAAKDTQGPRQTHVAALQPATIKRFRGCNGDTGEEWGTRRSPAVKAAFLPHVGRHRKTNSGTISTHGTHRRKHEEVRWRHSDTGDKGPRQSCGRCLPSPTGTPLHQCSRLPPPHQHSKGATAEDATRATSTQPQSPTAAAITTQD
ncbi:hypothetical protein TcCL_Unassigned02139 [Trypanosoma cruzi]|nr:hypothetical protein TcCL_Unassigned02139 [Trypanosoma cruzi]